MSAALYAFVEPALVALIVLISAIAVLRKHAPTLWTRLTGRSGAAASCHDDGASSKRCGSGCGSCGSTGPSSGQPIKLHKAPH